MAFAEVAVGLRQAADRREDEADGEIRDLVRQHVGRVRHDDAALRSRLRVHRIIADAEIRDKFEGGEPVHQGAIHRSPDAEAADAWPDLAQQGIGIGGAVEAVDREAAVERALDQRMHPAKQQDVGGLSSGHVVRASWRIRAADRPAQDGHTPRRPGEASCARVASFEIGRRTLLRSLGQKRQR